MRRSSARFLVHLVALFSFASAGVGVVAQQGKLPGKESVYNGNRLKPDPNPGGPAPVHDISGSWAGNLTPNRGEIPPLTPAGEKLFSLKDRGAAPRSADLALCLDGRETHAADEV